MKDGKPQTISETEQLTGRRLIIGSDGLKGHSITINLWILLTGVGIFISASAWVIYKYTNIEKKVEIVENQIVGQTEKVGMLQGFITKDIARIDGEVKELSKKVEEIRLTLAKGN